MSPGRAALGPVAVAVAVAAALLAGCSEPTTDPAPADDPDEASPPERRAAGERSWCGEPSPAEIAPPVQPEGAPPTIEVEAEAARLPYELADDQGALCESRGYGRGASLIDLDGDGWDDLFLADADNRWNGDRFGVARAFRNVEGTFEPWDLGISDDDVFMNGGGVFGDYDRDGAPDLFLLNGNNTGSSRLALYRNDLAGSGRFEETTAEAGITTTSGPWWGAAWGDLDGDHDLDLVVTGPTVLMYENLGDGTFQEVAAERGITGYDRPRQALQNPLLVDLDGDHALDLFLSQLDGSPSQFFMNDGTGHFTRSTERTGVDTENLTLVFSAVAGDFDQDGSSDIWLGRWWFQDYLLLNDGTGRFTTLGPEAGIITQVGSEDMFADLDDFETTPAAGSENTMGIFTADLDLNGYPDVIVGGGDPTRSGPLIAFCGRPDPGTRLRFSRCSEPLRSVIGDTRAHGAAAGDVNHDGHMDLILNLGGFPLFDAATGAESREVPRLFLGTGVDGVRTAQLQLVAAEGRSTNGTHVRVEGDAVRHYTAHPTQGFQSQDSLRLTVITDDAAEVVVTWPDGSTTSRRVEAGDDVRIEQPAS